LLCEPPTVSWWKAVPPSPVGYNLNAPTLLLEPVR
jgi:hypothetical protein